MAAHIGYLRRIAPYAPAERRTFAPLRAVRVVEGRVYAAATVTRRQCWRYDPPAAFAERWP